MRHFPLTAAFFALIVASTGAMSGLARAEESTVYSVFQGVDLGNPGETPKKDFYVSMGTHHGLKEGSVLEVRRRIATYDLKTEQFHKDLTVPIAKIKVIHVEADTAVARLEQMLPPDKAPNVSPRAVMAGDLVRISK